MNDVKRALCCADNKATKLLRELEEFGLIERKRRGLGKPSLVYVKNFSAESSKPIFQKPNIMFLFVPVDRHCFPTTFTAATVVQGSP